MRVPIMVALHAPRSMRRLSCVEKIDDIRDGTAAMHRVGNQRSCRCALKRGNSDFLGWATNAVCLKRKRYRVGNVADTRSQSNVVSAEAIKQNRSIAAKADDVGLFAEREQKFCETLLRRREKNTTGTRFGCQTNVREISNKSTSPSLPTVRKSRTVELVRAAYRLLSRAATSTCSTFRQSDEVLATWTNIAALPLAHLLNVLDAESVGNVLEFQAQLFAPGFEFGAGHRTDHPSQRPKPVGPPCNELNSIACGLAHLPTKTSSCHIFPPENRSLALRSRVHWKSTQNPGCHHQHTTTDQVFVVPPLVVRVNAFFEIILDLGRKVPRMLGKFDNATPCQPNNTVGSVEFLTTMPPSLIDRPSVCLIPVICGFDMFVSPCVGGQGAPGAVTGWFKCARSWASRASEAIRSASVAALKAVPGSMRAFLAASRAAFFGTPCLLRNSRALALLPS